MEPEKFMQFQHQMRENSTEYQDFLKDLDCWTDDMKKKDEKLKKTENDYNKKLPPVRNSLNKKKTKKKKIIADKKSERISGYDFRSWDKFDVDKALKEVDVEGEEEYETDEEWEEQRRKEQANLLKEQGNQRFKEGKYDDAIECYTNGISFDPENVVLLSNRSMALLKQKKYAAADEDASIAIALDNKFGKAYYRRAMARLGLNKLEAAKSDLEKLVKLEPDNKLVRKELEKIDKQLNPEDFDDIRTVKPISKPPHKRSKKPLKKIKIEEVGKQTNNLSSMNRIEETKVLVHPPEINKTSSKPSEINKAKQKNVEKQTTESLDKKTESIEKVKTVPNVPTTSVQLEKHWKELKNNKKLLHSYFEKIDRKSYAKLFGLWFEKNILDDILELLKSFYSKKQSFAILLDISLIKRFSTAYSFLENSQRDYIKELTEEFSTDPDFDKNTVEKFIKQQKF